MENKRKHLELIENIIERMAEHSFLLKKWAATLCTALVALGDMKQHPNTLIVSAVPVALLWILDGFYLHKERAYRALYDRVRMLPEERIDFCMDTSALDGGRITWFRSVFSKTLLIFYLTLVGVIVLVTAVIR